MSNNGYDVPVLMYHSIGVPNKDWDWNYLTCPYDLFEKQLKAIRSLGYQTISLKQLHGYMANGEQIPDKAIAITFDDGYLDVWVYAYPLLKKYEMCASVFINPDFVDPNEGPRNTYKCDHRLEGLAKSGFLNWDEITKMDSEGVVFAESHALTHTWYPVSSRIVDFRHPGDSYKWMTWNANVKEKYRLQIDDEKLVVFGQPVYEHGKSLMCRMVHTDRGLDRCVSEYVEKNGGRHFFDAPGYKDKLASVVEKYRGSNDLKYVLETDDQYRERVRHELAHTKSILETKLGRDVIYLCWPGGSATDIGMEIARSLGYKLFNSARDMTSSERQAVRNVAFGGDRTKRFATIVYFNGKENADSKIVYAGYVWMRLFLSRYHGSIFSRILMKVMSVVYRFYYGYFSR